MAEPKKTYITKKEIRAKAFAKVVAATEVLDGIEEKFARGLFDKKSTREELRVARCLLIESCAQLDLTLGKYV